MTDALQLLREFRSDMDAPDEAAVARLYDRATAPRRHAAAWKARLAIAIAFGLLVIGAGTALAIYLTGPSPGFTAGVSAMETLPQTPLSAEVPDTFVRHAAQFVGVASTEFVQRLRRLRSGLTLGPGRSQGRGELWAYVGRDGAGCIFLTGQGGGCFNARSAGCCPGVEPSLEPGYPGQTPAVVAVVADNVRDVELVVGDRHSQLEIINNSVYADLDGLRAGETIALHSTYADGTCRTTRLINPRGGGIPQPQQSDGC